MKQKCFYLYDSRKRRERWATYLTLSTSTLWGNDEWVSRQLNHFDKMYLVTLTHATTKNLNCFWIFVLYVKPHYRDARCNLLSTWLFDFVLEVSNSRCDRLPLHWKCHSIVIIWMLRPYQVSKHMQIHVPSSFSVLKPGKASQDPK